MLVKLPPFWPDAPGAWFTSTELQFNIRGITAQPDRFCLAAAALDKETLKQVLHIIDNPDKEKPYDVLKEALVASHQLNTFQRVELVIAMPPLGDRKPTQLAADMLATCPPKEQKSAFLVALFLQRLPRELRVLLASEDHEDLRLLAAKADQLLAFSSRQAHEVVAALDHTGPSQTDTDDGTDDADTVAAVRYNRPRTNKPRKTSAKDNALDKDRRNLCYYHRKWGAQAQKCADPCTWSGN